MSETNNTPTLLGEALLQTIREAVREEFQALMGQNGHQANLLTAEQLAERLQVHKNWVYEQSRQGNIPTIRVGRHIRFSLHEVLTHQRQN
ncbi:MAG: helix-turn-helix domain-containing protein, partial [Nitrososphaerales archaeon]